MRPAVVVSLGIIAIAMGSTAVGVRAGEWAPVCLAPGEQRSNAIASDDAGGAYIGWIDERSGYNADVYVQLVSRGVPGPAPGWPTDGFLLTAITCTKYDLSLAPDGAGGLLAAWADNRCNGQLQIYALRLGATRVLAAGWPSNGILVSTPNGRQVLPAIVADGAGGAIVSWMDTTAAATSLFAMHVGSSGTLDPSWPAGGALVATGVQRHSKPCLLSDGAGGALLVWEAVVAGQSDVLAQHLTAAGVPAAGWVSGGLSISRAAGDQAAPCAIADGGGGVIAAWFDRRSLPPRIFAGRLTASGIRPTGWNTDGNQVCSIAAAASSIVMTGDGAGGAFLAWQDTRFASTGSDIFAQHLTATGALATGWSTSGIAVCSADSAQVSPAITGDGSGGVFVTWSDRRNAAVSGADMYAERLSGAGGLAPGWATNGTLLSNSVEDQTSSQIAPDGASGAFVVWLDGRAKAVTGTDVWLGELSASGPLTTQARRLTAFHRDGQTFMAWTAWPGKGWTYRVYRSSSPIVTPSDLAAAALVGTVGDSSAYDRRFSTILNQPYGYSLDSLAAPLDPASGLFVFTPTLNGAHDYAVTSQNGVQPEDRTLTAGDNALTAAVSEIVARPRPVYQREVVSPGVRASVFTLWTSPRESPLYPAMANRDGMAFDCAVNRYTAAPGGALLVKPHARGGTFLDAVPGTGTAGEWVLALDDPLPNGENTFWFGYHPDYDVVGNANPPPTNGTVVNYTFRRVQFTLDWMERTFPVDTTRVYAFGYSMGGIGSLELAFWLPRRIAAVMAVAGKFDFSFLSEANPAAWFNTGNSMRTTVDRMWGTVPTNLPASSGLKTFVQMDMSLLVDKLGSTPLPPIIALNGKRDEVTGWGEKIPFYNAMRARRLGGSFLWGPDDHNGTTGRVWAPMINPAYLYRYRTNLSYPALANCSLDANPGDGTFASGDSIGTINAFVEWDPNLDDQVDHWQVVLRLRDLTSTSGTVRSADSCQVDVTPVRLQRFVPSHLGDVAYSVKRLADGALIASGRVAVDSLGRVTIPAVKVYRAGTTLLLGTGGPPSLTVPPTPALELALRLAGDPAHGAANLLVTWPSTSTGTVDVLDIAGRRLRSLPHASGPPGPARLTLDLRDLPAGLYFVRAAMDGAHVTRRLVLLP